MRKKSKTPQKETKEAQVRDFFQTPNYAVDLLIPFIPQGIHKIWECASGSGKIAKRLRESSYNVFETDIQHEKPFDFVDGRMVFLDGMDAIITNPPYSLKHKFYQTCMKYNLPFALLIPADYTGWIIQAVVDGAEKIIPTRRIDFLTPNVVKRINSIEDTDFNSIDEIPSWLLAKYSSSDFHSMWLTWGFNLGRTETFVELSLQQKKENI